MLEVLHVAVGQVKSAGSRRLERAKRWNFVGVVITVGSSTALYVNVLAHFVLTFSRRYYLNDSTYGNPFCFGLAVDSICNVVGMILLCGMFKDVEVGVEMSSRIRSITAGNRRSLKIFASTAASDLPISVGVNCNALENLSGGGSGDSESLDSQGSSNSGNYSPKANSGGSVLSARS
jgi:hypothetical protein